MEQVNGSIIEKDYREQKRAKASFKGIGHEGVIIPRVDHIRQCQNGGGVGSKTVSITLKYLLFPKDPAIN